MVNTGRESSKQDATNKQWLRQVRCFLTVVVSYSCESAYQCIIMTVETVAGTLITLIFLNCQALKKQVS